ncbi:MAG: nucleotidyltransferase domain-containing protein [Myxococcota bacterium]
MPAELDMDWLRAQLEDFAEALVFASVSGAHLYGFPSENSDVDIRGAHLLPTSEIVRLGDVEETTDFIDERDGIEFDLVSHELGKFLRMLLERNAIVLEQIFSPHLVVEDGTLETLRRLASGCVTRHHFHHYDGFARSQWALHAQSGGLKPLLYCYRAYLTGVHLVSTGDVEANLEVLAKEYEEPLVLELIREKRAGEEKMQAPGNSIEFEEVRDRLKVGLHQAYDSSRLRERPSQETREAISDYLVERRLNYLRR